MGPIRMKLWHSNAQTSNVLNLVVIHSNRSEDFIFIRILYGACSNGFCKCVRMLIIYDYCSNWIFFLRTIINDKYLLSLNFHLPPQVFFFLLLFLIMPPYISPNVIMNSQLLLLWPQLFDLELGCSKSQEELFNLRWEWDEVEEKGLTQRRKSLKYSE